MRTWLVVGLLLSQTAALGQDPNRPEQEGEGVPAGRMRALQEKAMKLIRGTRELGNWDEQYEYMIDATERVFERAGWDGESDLFSLEMIREVDSIPPWAMRERYDKVLEMVGDRYLLDEGQLASLENHFTRVNIELFSQHSDRIMQYALEAIQTRAAGEPFTSEQVARWVTLAEPVFKDARRKMNESAKQFTEELDVEQRELFDRDLNAANRRMIDIDRMGQKWKRGEWDPHDWGMEDDPIQNRAARPPRASEAAEPAARSDRREVPREPRQPPPPLVAEPEKPPKERTSPAHRPQRQNEDAWAKYVREFIEKYELNDEQQQRAWLFYQDSKERDEVFERRFARQTKAMRAKGEAASDERTRAALRKQTEKHRLEKERLFNQLKRRLERLPTRAQRRNAESGERGSSDSSPKKKTKPKGKP